MKTELRKILSLPSIEAAPLLLGWGIKRKLPEGEVRLKIVETEAYHQDDPASHSFRGKTLRTVPMFEAGGLVYVYFTYGMHYCVNIVTGPVGRGEAILLRAAEPLTGIEIMQKHRDRKGITQLANGPAKLAQALGIDSTELSGQPLGSKTFELLPPVKALSSKQIVVTTRVGIQQAINAELRFYIQGSPFISKL